MGNETAFATERARLRLLPSSSGAPFCFTDQILTRTFQRAAIGSTNWSRICRIFCCEVVHLIRTLRFWRTQRLNDTAAQGMTGSNAALIVLDPERPNTWPQPLLDFLGNHHQLFLDWEQRSGVVTGSQYDEAIYALQEILNRYALRGWHCTRLTDAEADAIISGGVQLPDQAMLNRRIDALIQQGHITPASAAILKSKNQAHESNGAGILCFMFFPPLRAGESEIGDFFRYWGGEALYNSHDRDPAMAAVIGSIGTPCLVEAEVPIALLAPHSFAFKIVRRFLVSRGFKTCEQHVPQRRW